MTEQLRRSPEPRESPSKHISRPGKFSNYYSIDERYSHVAGVLRQQAIFDDYMTNTGNATLQFFSEECTELLERDEENKDRAEHRDCLLTYGHRVAALYKSAQRARDNELVSLVWVVAS